MKLENNRLNVPNSICLPNDTNGLKITFVLVENEAFVLSKHIMRP